MTEVSWKATHLNKGQSMSLELNGCQLSVAHVDRTLDPFLAGVIRNGIIIYSGLHPTLSDARQTCIEKSKP